MSSCVIRTCACARGVKLKAFVLTVYEGETMDSEVCTTCGIVWRDVDGTDYSELIKNNAVAERNMQKLPRKTN